MNFDEYRTYDATGLAKLVADKEVSAAELLALARERAAAVNPRINAIVRDVPAAPPDELTGPFAGVPFLIKDLGAGLRRPADLRGSRALMSLPAAEHATVVQRWIDAGLVIFGKTNTPEFGARASPSRSVGAGAQPVGPHPHARRVVGRVGVRGRGGHRAVRRRQRRRRIDPHPGGMLRAGRSETRARADPVRARRPASPCTAPPCRASCRGRARHGRDARRHQRRRAGGPYAPALPAFPVRVVRRRGSRHAADRRAGAVGDHPYPHPEAFAAVDATVPALTELGHHVEELPQAPFDDAALAREFLLAWFVYTAWEVAEAKRLTGAGDDEFERDTLDHGGARPRDQRVDYVDAVQRRHEHTRRLTTFFESYDLLLTPTLATPPPKIGEFDLPVALQRGADVLLKTRTARVLRFTKIVDDMVDKNLGWVPYTQLANLTGRPAITLPLHWTAAGLPLGVQFVAPLAGESLLLKLAAQLEQALPWGDRVAPV